MQTIPTVLIANIALSFTMRVSPWLLKEEFKIITKLGYEKLIHEIPLFGNLLFTCQKVIALHTVLRERLQGFTIHV